MTPSERAEARKAIADYRREEISMYEVFDALESALNALESAEKQRDRANKVLSRIESAAETSLVHALKFQRTSYEELIEKPLRERLAATERQRDVLAEALRRYDTFVAHAALKAAGLETP